MREFSLLASKAFFRFSGENLAEFKSFSSLKQSAIQGKNPSKCQLIRISRFEGVKEQTNRLTDILMLAHYLLFLFQVHFFVLELKSRK